MSLSLTETHFLEDVVVGVTLDFAVFLLNILTDFPTRVSVKIRPPECCSVSSLPAQTDFHVKKLALTLAHAKPELTAAQFQPTPVTVCHTHTCTGAVLHRTRPRPSRCVGESEWAWGGRGFVQRSWKGKGGSRLEHCLWHQAEYSEWNILQGKAVKKYATQTHEERFEKKNAMQSK